MRSFGISIKSKKKKNETFDQRHNQLVNQQQNKCFVDFFLQFVTYLSSLRVSFLPFRVFHDVWIEYTRSFPIVRAVFTAFVVALLCHRLVVFVTAAAVGAQEELLITLQTHYISYGLNKMSWNSRQTKTADFNQTKLHQTNFNSIFFFSIEWCKWFFLIIWVESNSTFTSEKNFKFDWFRVWKSPSVLLPIQIVKCIHYFRRVTVLVCEWIFFACIRNQQSNKEIFSAYIFAIACIVADVNVSVLCETSATANSKWTWNGPCSNLFSIRWSDNSHTSINTTKNKQLYSCSVSVCSTTFFHLFWFSSFIASKSRSRARIRPS